MADALRPEASHPAGEKAKANVIVHGNELRIKLRAYDTSALRAITSSYLRMLKAIGGVLTVSEVQNGHSSSGKG
jgi:tRNA threonylcarbamoyladenosine modification (KEOPS) complex  Pcc1 subunit